LHFVKPGTVSKPSAKLLSELQALRERADYQVDLAYDAADVYRHFQSAAPLIEELSKVAGETAGLRLQSLRKTWRDARAAVAPAPPRRSARR
jgi:hypothetical protein